MKSVDSLIDNAIALCGTEYKAAKTLGVKQGPLGEVRKGRRTAPVLLVGKLAEMAGEDPLPYMVETLASLQTNEQSANELRRLFRMRNPKI